VNRPLPPRRSQRQPLRVVLVALVAAASVGCGSGDPDVAATTPEIVALTAAPLPSGATRVAAPSPTPSPAPTAPAAGEAAAAPASSPVAPEGPTASDRARFVADYEPDGASGLEHVAVDVDGDGQRELLFTYVVDGTARVDVAWWSGDAYAVAARGEGGAAAVIWHVRVADVNGDDVTEVVTFQRDDSSSSLSIWAVVGRDLLGLRAVGGCDDGAFTYGVVGADLTDVDGDGTAEILATCDDSPLPVRAWSEETYRWDGSAYVAEPQQPPATVAPTPTATESETAGPPGRQPTPPGRGGP
jgi:hypothetical protein